MLSREQRLTDFQTKIEHTMTSLDLLDAALTHSSYSNESKKKIQNSERLEFLGDSILNMIVSEYLFVAYPDVSEGNLTKLRASIVSERSLVQIASKLCLGKYILLGKGEESSGGRNKPSILADALESLIAAIYLDAGLEKAKAFVINYITENILNSQNGISFKDYKTELQEVLQEETGVEIEYRIIEESGPDHDKAFIAEVYLNSKSIGRGFGKSKKEAEQQAAKSALLTKQA